MLARPCANVLSYHHQHKKRTYGCPATLPRRAWLHLLLPPLGAVPVVRRLGHRSQPRSLPPEPHRRSVVAMSFLREALKGAKTDIESAGHELFPRLARAARVARILGLEVAAIIALAPYGAYAMSVYRRLTFLPEHILPPRTERSPSAVTAAVVVDSDAPQSQPQQQPTLSAGTLRQLPIGKYGVAVHRQVPYGPAPRNMLDVYVPLLSPPLITQTLPTGSSPQEQLLALAAQQAAWQSEQQRQVLALPVVFFTHGGVWASGETWQYAPLATRLAQAGLVVVVPTYTIYPEALTGTMVEEVSTALSWTFDNASRYGGDPARITAAGHSAGGHLVAWALLRRAVAGEAAAAASTAALNSTAAMSPANAAAPGNLPEVGVSAYGVCKQGRVEQWVRQQQQLDEQPQGSAAHLNNSLDTAAYLLGGGGTSLPGALHALHALADVHLHPQPGVDMSYDNDSAAAAAGAAAAVPAHAEVDSRMPAMFVGMSGVYDIAKHYEFEKSRAVHELSMMKRAVGGPAGFAAASPSVILATAADAAAAALPPRPRQYDQRNTGPNADGHFTSYFTSFELLGDAIPARAGLSGVGDGGAIGSGSVGGGGGAADWRNPPFSLAAAARLPPFVVMGSCSDHMVPWHEGAELVLQLRRCGVPVRHLLYNHVGHGDFVMSWRPRDVRKATPVNAMMGANAADDSDPWSNTEGLLPCALDFLRIATGRVQSTATPWPLSSCSRVVESASPLTLLARAKL